MLKAGERRKLEAGSWRGPWAACVSTSVLGTHVTQHLGSIAKTHSASTDARRGLGLQADGIIIGINKGLQKGVHMQMPFCVLSK